MSSHGNKPIKSRGATLNPPNRFASTRTEAEDDGWGMLDEEPEALATTLTPDTSKSVIARNTSPDIPFDRSINPYRGCEHGCIYCYARPSHAWLGLSPGLDFESRLFYKPDAAAILKQELARKSYDCAPIALGPNTDSYQPVERRLGITRSIVQLLLETRHPVGLVTKSALVERDIDLYREMAQEKLANIMITVTTLDPVLSRKLEPRAAVPKRRLQIIERLAGNGIPVGVLIAPVIPVLTDTALEDTMQAVRDAGALTAGYILLRLPHEVSPLFRAWLETHWPEKASHVMSQIQQARGGKDNVARFGERMRGTGEYAGMINQRFRLMHRKLEFPGLPELRTDLFEKPRLPGDQMELF
ncbi:MAG: PA0069 family radical SAM protein [Gammaproteobacteria bacterium]|jgi:DNA repair photolyase